MDRPDHVRSTEEEFEAEMKRLRERGPQQTFEFGYMAGYTLFARCGLLHYRLDRGLNTSELIEGFQAGLNDWHADVTFGDS